MRILLTGASGFIGSGLLAALETAGHVVTTVGRSPNPARSAHVVADLRRDDFFQCLMAQDIVLHAASVTGGDAFDVWEGNVEVARRLVAAAVRLDLPVVYVSTTGVYGRSFGYFGEPQRTPRRPTPALSRSRAAAEDLVIASGGTVIRPHVVFGPGDRWVVPKLTELMLQESAWLGGPDIKVAAISVGRLSQGITSLLGRSSLPPALHAAEPDPVAVADLVRSGFRTRDQPLPTRTLSIDDALVRLRGTGVSCNALSMLGKWSRMNSSEFWQANVALTPLASRPSSQAASPRS